jgi:3-demethylubiquinone-9 3-methyltransferase
MVVEFQLDGQDFVALNGGPLFKFTEAISFVVNCDTQEEVDYFWEKLSAGGEESRCGWAERQIRFVVAGGTRGLERDGQRQGPRASKTRDARDVANGQDRYPNAKEGVRSKIKREPDWGCDDERNYLLCAVLGEFEKQLNHVRTAIDR